MTKTAIIVMLALIFVPMFVGWIFRVVAATKARNDESVLNKPAPKWVKKAAIVYLSVYLTAIVGAGIWVAMSIFEDQFTSLDPKGVQAAVALMGAIVVTEGGIIYGFMRRIKKKLPRPSVDISTEEYLEWENKHSDARNKMLLPMLGSVLGALILIVAVFVLVVGYLF